MAVHLLATTEKMFGQYLGTTTTENMFAHILNHRGLTLQLEQVNHFNILTLYHFNTLPLYHFNTLTLYQTKGMKCVKILNILTIHGKILS